MDVEAELGLNSDSGHEMEWNGSLLKFALWWLRHKPFAVPADGLGVQGNLNSVVMYREGVFQVELFLCGPFLSVPPHTHPNVESLEKLLCGDVNFLTQENNMLRGFLHLPHDRVHWGSLQKAAFFSFQKWSNGVKPTTILNDWEGEQLQ